jgi:hypothetical protein
MARNEQNPPKPEGPGSTSVPSNAPDGMRLL